MSFQADISATGTPLTASGSEYMSATTTTSSTQATPMKKGKCFRCGKEGHWAADCPKKSMGLGQPYPRRVAAGNGSGEPGSSGVICRCRAGVCEPRVAKSSGEVYYICPAESWKRCDFFMWQNKLKSGSVKQLQYPMCSCGAGVCVLGWEAGTRRQYFKCRVPKGQGACSFRQWLDVPVSTTKSMELETNELSAPQTLGKQANHGLFNEDDSRRKCLKITQPEGSQIKNSDRFSSNSSASLVCSNTKEGSVTSSMEFEDLSPELLKELMEYEYPLVGDDKSSCKQLKITESEESPVNSCAQLSTNSANSFASSYGKEVSMMDIADFEQFDTDEDLIDEVIASESTISHVDEPGVITNDSQMEEVLETAPPKYQNHVQLRQLNFCRQLIAAATDLPQDNSISLMLGAQYLGWLGRLAFGSPRFLMLPLHKNWFCCIFPNFDPIIVPSGIGRFDDKDQSVSTVDKSLARPQESVMRDLPAVILKEPSAPGTPPYVAEPNNVTAAAIMEAFGQAAVLIQSNFLTRLESMDLSCHEAMVKEANTAFASLDHLKVDYRPFYQQVKDFIDAAASLNQIERSKRNDVLFRDCLNRCTHEKLRLEQLSSEHNSVMNSLTRSQECLQSLHNEAEEVRNRLLRIEKQVSACTVETRNLQIRLAELSGQINECEDNLQCASLEAEAAQKIFMQREAEFSAAWDVFETAKLQLRNNHG
ncbi:unnamed protein product [Rhodiola kirilowii]